MPAPETIDSSKKRPVTIGILLAFFSVTWVGLSFVLGLLLQIRGNDLHHIYELLLKTEAKIDRHIEASVEVPKWPSTKR